MTLPHGQLVFWEIRSQGHLDNGGSFDTNITTGTDYSQQNAAEQVYTDLVIDGVTNTIISSVARPFASSRDEGNIISITSGTGFTVGRYSVRSVDGSGNATLDRAVGTVASTGGNGRFGGAITMQGDAFFETQVQDGNIIYVKKDGTHTLTENLLVANDGAVSFPIVFRGYNTTRADGGESESNRPLIACGAFTWSFDNNWNFYDLEFTVTHANGMDFDEISIAYRCKSNNTSGTSGRFAFFLGFRGQIVSCEAQSVNGWGIRANTNSPIIGCYVHDCEDGINVGQSNSTVTNCIVANCVDDGINANNGCNIFNCLLYNCSEGISIGGTTAGLTITSCNLVNCTTGIQKDSAADPEQHRYFSNNFFGNTTDTNNVASSQIYDSTFVDPDFVDADNGDFTPGAGYHGTGQVFIGGLNSGVSAASPIQVAAGGGGGGIAHLIGNGKGLVG